MNYSKYYCGGGGGGLAAGEKIKKGNVREKVNKGKGKREKIA